MSYTNQTTHYALPQYVATDKPKYLTDFNETMVAIDTQMYTNATAAATAQTAAEGAQSTADGAVSSIGSLNTQINGDPTDPSDTGLAGDVSSLDGDVNTIQALLGNGTPTTSNQTVIGAVNAIEASIAPAEDSATLGANYDTGEKFARGGVVYEALTDLTSGTAFTSLTLNTDYKVADTLVKQIADANADISEVNSKLKDFSKTLQSGTSAAITGDDSGHSLISFTAHSKKFFSGNFNLAIKSDNAGYKPTLELKVNSSKVYSIPITFTAANTDVILTFTLDVDLNDNDVIDCNLYAPTGATYTVSSKSVFANQSVNI